MALVALTLISLAVLALVLWANALWRAHLADVAERRRAEDERREQLRQEREDQLLRQPGRELICLGCNTRFPGPMPETGCPNCHITSLVAPADSISEPGSDSQSLQEGNNAHR